MRFVFTSAAVSLLSLAAPAHSAWIQQAVPQSQTRETQSQIIDTRPLSFRQLEWDYGNLSSWQRWWALERDRYASPRNHARRGTASEQQAAIGQVWATRVEDVKAPTRAQKEYLIRPALLEMFADAKDRDVSAESLLALARVGMFPQETVQALRPALRAPSQDLTRSAILGLGLVGDQLAISELTAILDNDEHGRWLLGTQQGITDQSRAWAALALANAARKADLNVQDEVQAKLLAVALGESGQADLQSSSLLAASMLRSAELAPVIEQLLGLLHDDSRAISLRAHTPSALARLATNADAETRQLIRAEMLQLLTPSTEGILRHGALVALGSLAADTPEGKDPVINSLIHASSQGKSPLERGLASMSLAQVAASASNVRRTVEAAESLAESIREADLESACWAMLASGLLLHERDDWQDVDRVRLERTILQQLTRSDHAERQAAAAIALGLAGQQRAAESLREICASEGQPNLRGHAAVALGLMQHSASEDLLLEQLDAARHDNTLLERTAVGLAMLGSDRAHAALLRMLAPEDGVTPTLAEVTAASRALGLVGHSRTAPFLLSAMDDTRMTPKSRALAARALGQIAERDAQPWQLAFTECLLHTSAPSSLLSWESRDGILDRR